MHSSALECLYAFMIDRSQKVETAHSGPIVVDVSFAIDFFEI